MTTNATPPFLSLAEAATILRVSRATAYRLVHAGELPAYRVGGSLRIDPDELSASLSSLRVTPATPRRGADHSDRRPVAA